MPNIEQEFCPAFYKAAADGKFQVWVLDAESQRYNCIGSFKHKTTAEVIMKARTYGFCATNQVMSTQH